MSPPDDGDREPSDANPSDSPEDPPPHGTADDSDRPTDDDTGAEDRLPADEPSHRDSSAGVRESDSDRRDARPAANREDSLAAGSQRDEVGATETERTADADRNRPRKLDERGTGDEDGTGDEEDGTDWWVFVYDIVNSAVAVLLVGALLFAVSGVWPPMVAVESPSMTPHMKTGDLVFVMEETRFPGEGAQDDTGVVTHQTGATTDADYRKFKRQGDVIVYQPNGNGDTTPIIHRAMFWVEEGENWYDRADKQSIGRYSACGNSTSEALPNCPAPHDGFITKGDANGRYDQVDQLSGPVRPAWVVGTAEVRIPLLGCLRLRSDRCANGIFGTVGQAAPPGCERCRVPVGR